LFTKNHYTPLEILSFATSHYVMRSQLLEGLKGESQVENNGRTRSWGMFPNLQHFEGVEGRAKALGWN